MDIRENMTQEAQNLEKRAFLLTKQHHRTSLQWNRANFWQGTVIAIATPILSIGTTSSVVVQYFVHSLPWSILTFCLSLTVSALTSVVAIHKPGTTATQHKKAETDYLYLSKQARMFYLFETTGENKTNEELSNQLKNLLKIENDLNVTYVSNAIPTWADEEKMADNQGVIETTVQRLKL